MRYSTRIKRGETVLIDATDIPDEFVIELVRTVRAAGGLPLVETRHSRISREIAREIDDDQARLISSLEMARMRQVKVFIGLRGAHNANESADVPTKQMRLFSKRMRPIHNRRVNKTKWVVLRWPTPSMAQSAGMSSEAFEDYYFDVCTMDYPRMARAMAPLQKRLSAADQVRLKGPGTDLTFSIKGIGAVSCTGEFNVPDGEVFTAPVKNSVNGTITFNAPSIYLGTRFENVSFSFKAGKIVEARGTPQKRLNEILDTDSGARFIGEFAIGFNPHILNPMGDILFDEKIAGSLHFTPGQAYEIADNGNRSAVHWDLVLIQRPEWGGGEIWVDGKLLRKDGLFVPKDLHPLNPKQLLGGSRR